MISQSMIHMQPSPKGATPPFQVAVVTPTILRPTLLHASVAVFSQKISGAGQWLIGIDKAVGIDVQKGCG